MKEDEAPECDPLLPYLEAALAASGARSATAFCYNEFQDPSFLLKARRGRRFKQARVREKVRQVIEKFGVEIIE